uniref:Uncharacterized protein n=1 Tax=Timema bartmani TaxID=61472 RepID=A0A7R9FC24_9NEOP|nr:unnamed protein product [Timema bartmani]
MCLCRMMKMPVDEYSKFLEELCKNKKVDVKEIKEKLTTCGVPGFSSSSSYVRRHYSMGGWVRASQTTVDTSRLPEQGFGTSMAPSRVDDAASKAASTVERLTDASKYTGAHKQRFDETGKGKGIAGRKDLPDSSGYVQGYINKDSYNKTH